MALPEDLSYFAQEEGVDYPVPQHPLAEKIEDSIPPPEGILLALEREGVIDAVAEVFADERQQELKESIDELRGLYGDALEKTDQLIERMGYDTLTHLEGKNSLLQHLAERLAEMERYAERKACVIEFDLDGFKEVNDTLGHAMGDALLIHFAQLLKALVRPYDIVTRTGGDEFILLIKEVDYNQARNIAAKIKRKTEDEFREYGVTASAGVATLRAIDTPDSVLSRADRNMYLSKRRAKKRRSAA